MLVKKVMYIEKGQFILYSSHMIVIFNVEPRLVKEVFTQNDVITLGIMIKNEGRVSIDHHVMVKFRTNYW